MVSIRNVSGERRRIDGCLQCVMHSHVRYDNGRDGEVSAIHSDASLCRLLCSILSPGAIARPLSDPFKATSPLFWIGLNTAVEGKAGVLNRLCPYCDFVVDPKPFAVLQLFHGLVEPDHLVSTVPPVGVMERGMSGRPRNRSQYRMCNRALILSDPQEVSQIT